MSPTSEPASLPWVSAHLFYTNDWEQFLLQGIVPLMQELTASQAIGQWFFIRYFEAGPHIRLRCQLTEPASVAKVRAALESHFARYFQQHPSERTLLHAKAWNKSAGPAKQWHANNTLAFVPYQPEVERYGGPAGIGLAEAQFCASSRAIISALAHARPEQGASGALTTALKMHVVFAAAVGLDARAARRFFNLFHVLWYNTTVGAAAASGGLPDLVTAFGRSFTQMKPQVVPLLKRTRQLATQGADAANPMPDWLSRWQVENTDIATQLSGHARGGRVAQAMLANTPLAATLAPDVLSCWGVYLSYVHMTNNRLGLANLDESYLGYVLMEFYRLVEEPAA